MNTQGQGKRLFYLVMGFFLLAAMSFLVGCSSVPEEAAPAAAGAEPTLAPPTEPAVAEVSPEAATEAFFTWYVDSVRAVFSGEREGSTAGLYHESEALTAALQEKLDRNSGQGADPVLHAQDLPQQISVEAWEVADDAACMIVHETWSGGSAVDLLVDLIRVDGAWLLDDIRAGTPATPDGATQLFYSWYLDYCGQGETRRNPLVDGAYRESDLLSPAFVEKVDALLAQTEGPGYDPILLAQDVPVAIQVLETAQQGDEATVTMARYFGGNPEAYPLEVKLQQQDGRWLIVDVVDPAAGQATSAADAVTGFYSWYLAYIGDPASDTFRNPLVNRAYREAPYVSEAFVAEIDAALDQQVEEYGGFMGDPILQAQAIPNRFEVVPGPATEILTVNLFFGETPSPVQVRVVEEDGRWLVDSIIPRGSTQPVDGAALSTGAGSDWQMFSEETYGFSFLLPAAWVAQAMDMDAPGMPEDWPVPAGYALMPQAMAEALAAQSGPPDPNAPPIIPPFLLEVVVGDQAAFDRAFVPAIESTTATYNGYEVLVERDVEEYTVVRYVFRHPENEKLWVVFSDALSEFPGREEQAAAVEAIQPAILESFTFTK